VSDDPTRRDALTLRTGIRHAALAVTLLILAAIAWGTLAGGLHQLPRSVTPGQKAETGVQLSCSLLSLLVTATCFWQRSRARAVRTVWVIALAATAGLSSLVWGPPMAGTALLFATATSLVALGLLGVLRFARAE